MPSRKVASPLVPASSSRLKPAKNAKSSSDQPPSPKKQRVEKVDDEDLKCAACPAADEPAPIPGKDAAADYDEWICCSHCNTWFHCICIHLEDPDEYRQWYCTRCIDASESASDTPLHQDHVPFANIRRPPRRRSSRVKDDVDYAAIQEGMPADPVGRWKKFLESHDVLPDRFRRMRGEQWTLDWLSADPTALSEPVLVPSSRPHAEHAPSPVTKAQASLDLRPATTTIPGMLVPPSEMTIFDVAAIVGPDTAVEVIDVASQSSSKTSWTLSEWADYFATPSHKKQKILNVISLEVTGTDFQRFVEAPQLVRDLDWVSRDWPETRRNKESSDNSWPKVQRYVLMGVAGAYSDWHIDFAGSSVYYHVVWGQKTFLFAPPTTKNLAAYRNWCSSTRQDFDWLGSHLHDLTRVVVKPGETMLIPSGWLHCVYTPKNTLVVGGNFLTDWNVATQWKLVEIEDATKVPKKFRFPHLKRLTWYVAQAWHDRLAFLDEEHIKDSQDQARDRKVPSAKVLQGIDLVCKILTDDIELIQDASVSESGDDKAVKLQKAAREAVPVLAIGKLEHAAEMVENLRQRLEKAKAMLADVSPHSDKGLTSKWGKRVAV